MSLPVKALRAPVPRMARVFLSFSRVNVPLLVRVLAMLKVEAAVVPSRLKVAPVLIVVVPPMVRFRELVSKVPLTPPPSMKLFASVRLFVSRLTLEPLFTVNL